MLWNRKGFVGVAKNNNPFAARNDTGHSGIDDLSINSPGWIFILLLLNSIVFYLDLSAGFARGYLSMGISLVGYALITAIFFFVFTQSGVPRDRLVRWITIKAILVIALPAGIFLFKQFVLDNDISQWGVFGQIAGVILLSWAPVVIMYYGGYMHYIVDQARKLPKLIGFIFSLLNAVIFLVLFISLVNPLIMWAGEQAEIDTGGRLTDVSILEAPKAAYKFGEAIVKQAVTDTRTTVDNAIEAATPTYYTSTAEKQQGARLGVYFSDIQPLFPVFSFMTTGPNNTQLTTDGIISDDVIWLGMLDARTFAEEMDVNINCSYTPAGANKPNVSVAARPPTQKIFFTGEFQDSYPFDCQIPMDMLLPVVQEHGINGRFSVDAEYTFDTWGYVTYTFMEREEFIALRRQNIEPATELGISRNARAVYTPGPMRLGLETQQMPIAIDVQTPDNNQNVRFGITLENAWATRGKVAKIHRVILQVPLPFTIDPTECVGTTGDYVDTYAAGFSVPYDPTGINPVVPEGYNWYEWGGVTIPENQRFVTFVCPLAIDDNAYPELLGADLSPKQLTFVAQANYDYVSTQPVNTRLGVEKI